MGSQSFVGVSQEAERHGTDEFAAYLFFNPNPARPLALEQRQSANNGICGDDLFTLETARSGVSSGEFSIYKSIVYVARDKRSKGIVLATFLKWT